MSCLLNEWAIRAGCGCKCVGSGLIMRHRTPQCSSMRQWMWLNGDRGWVGYGGMNGRWGVRRESAINSGSALSWRGASTKHNSYPPSQKIRTHEEAHDGEVHDPGVDEAEDAFARHQDVDVVRRQDGGQGDGPVGKLVLVRVGGMTVGRCIEHGGSMGRDASPFSLPSNQSLQQGGKKASRVGTSAKRTWAKR